LVKDIVYIHTRIHPHKKNLPNGLENWNNNVKPLVVSVVIVVKIMRVVEAHPVAATFPVQVRRQMMEARRDVKSKNLNVVTIHMEELAGSHKLLN
jgi:hypothetical protein